MADITMPQLGETVTEGTITRWFKQIGDEVAEDEPLFEVSTDKVDSEVPSPTSGVLREIRVAEGETVDVGVVLAVVGDATDAPSPGGRDSSMAEEAPLAQEAPAAQPPAQAAPPAQPPADQEAPAEAAAAPSQPPAAGPAPAPGVPEAPADRGASDGPSRRGGTAPGPSVLLSPVVRRLITEHGLDPASLTGTGVGGRITRGDVMAAVDAGRARSAGAAPAPAATEAAAPPAPAARLAPAAGPAPTAPGPAPAPPAPPSSAIRPGTHDEVVPHTNIRRRTAEHMSRSKATSAHVSMAMEVDFEAVEAVRRSAGSQWMAEEGFALTYLPFVSRAVVEAVREFPHVNSSFTEDELIVHHQVNLGFAVDLDYAGLMVPVVREADGKRMRAIAREVRDLAERARSRRLGPDEISGGTFTITNPGPAGTLFTLAIINQPQVAILSTDGVRRRPVVVTGADGSEAIAIHSVGTLALTWDHRAFDGMYAARFLAAMRDLIQTRDWAAEL